MSIPEKLAARAVPQENQITSIAFSRFGALIVQRRFKFGSEDDPIAWCELHWRDDYSWSVGVTPCHPPVVRHADVRK